MISTNTQNIQLCCYCGVRKATTKDHIPPKSIFTKPRPSDLITVPCCFQCNNEASKYDEKFKTYLGMHVARNGGEAEKLFRGVLRTTRHNNKLRNTISKNAKPVYITSNSGLITGKGVSILWDSIVHDFTIERITRGLFFHHYGKIIGNNAKVRAYWFKEPQSDLMDILHNKSIANGLFIYSYNKADETDYDSVWSFNFYGGHFAGAVVLSEKN